MASTQEPLSQDDVFDLLSNRRRRFAINYLLRVDRAVSIQELSKELALWEFEVDEDELSDKQKKRIYVALYQTHVPKLEDAGVVEYDSDAGLVELTDRATELQPYVDEAPQEGRPWPWYYVAVAVVGGLAYAGAVLGAPLLGAVGPAVVGFTTLSAFVVLAVAHYQATAR